MDVLFIEVEVVAALRHVTREYFLYKTSLEKYFEIEGNPFAEPVNVFTNIENGLGISWCFINGEEVKLKKCLSIRYLLPFDENI